MSPAITVVLLWHLAGGLALLLAGAAAARTVFKASYPSPGATFIAVLAAVCAGSGIAMLAAAALGFSARRIPGGYEAHVLSGLALCVFLLTGYLFSRLGKRARSGLAAGSLIAGSSVCLATVSYQPDFYFRALTATTPEQAHNPLFPAGAIIRSARGWSSAQPPGSCGASGCHVQAHNGWMNSQHARSAESPAYSRALEETARRKGRDSVRWCAGCHDPASLRPGSRTAGIDCLSCHAMSDLPLRSGGGLAVYTPPELYPFAGSAGGWPRRAHDFLLRVRPLPHTASLTGPTRMGSSLSCLPCHRLGITAAQNELGYLLYDDTWGQWHSSAFSGQSLHTLRAADSPRSCVSCHPPHGRPAQSEETRTERLRGAVSIQIFALRRRSDGASERVEAPLGKRRVSVLPGEKAAIDVLVQNRGLGHALPAGAPDLKIAWIELELKDDRGRVLAHSGRPQPFGQVERSAHRYGASLLSADGRLVTPGLKSEPAANLFDSPEGPAQEARTRYRAVDAASADVARYTFTTPAAAGGLHFTARLWYSRTLRPIAGASRPILLGSDSVIVNIGRRAESPEGPAPKGSEARDDPRDSDSFFAYGSGLFAQKDSMKARQAFQQSRALLPDEPDCWIAIARTYLEEGDLLSARSHLEKAIALGGTTERARAWLGRTLRVMGRYENALRILTPLLRSHPEDRITWFDVGLCQFQLGRFSEAVESFQQLLYLAPDDAAAHLNLMLCYRRMMRLTDARREEAIYRNLRGESRLPALVQPFLQGHGEEALEASIRHEHRLEIAR